MRQILIIFFLLLTVNVWAGPQLDGVSPDKVLTKDEQIELKGNLKGYIFQELMPVRNDYVDKDNRGTVEFNPKKGINMLGREVFEASNYSKHKVIIPNGTVIEWVNFAQKEPHTVAIFGKNLHFIHCNLRNVELDPTWMFDGGVKGHTRDVIIIDGGKTYEVMEREIDGKFVEIQRTEIIIE